MCAYQPGRAPLLLLRRACAVVGFAALGLLAPPQGVAADVLIGAAVSLRTPLERVARDFERAHPGARVRASFGASSTLAAQARAGAPLDVFVSADPRLVDRLADAGWVAARRELARNRLVLVARPDLALARPEDLLAPQVRRVAVPAAAVPLGGYARGWLERRGLLAGLAGRVVQTEHARATLAAVENGHADAAVVYATDARAVVFERLELPIDAREQPAIRYVAALRAGAGDEARRLFAFLGDAATRAHLREAGFGAP